MPTVTMRQLLEAGVHFGHQTRRWNPKMRPFIFAERNGIHIIDLAQTVQRLDVAVDFVRATVGRGEAVLFVGTKKQAQEPIAEEATRAGMPYINQRWLGGFLTNFLTIKKRLGLLEQLEAREANGEFEWMTKKEASRVRDELTRLRRTLGGVRKMKRLPGALFVIDPQRERIAVTEARKLELPVIGTGDTNIDPDMLDFIIPANDDAIRAIRLLCRIVADAALQGAEERALRAEAAPEVEAEAEGAEAASDEYMAALAAGTGLIFEPGSDEEEEEEFLALEGAPPAPAPRARVRAAEPEEEAEEVAAAAVDLAAVAGETPAATKAAPAVEAETPAVEAETPAGEAETPAAPAAEADATPKGDGRRAPANRATAKPRTKRTAKVSVGKGQPEVEADGRAPGGEEAAAEASATSTTEPEKVESGAPTS
jgi:small subunit ribosomal protein S2